MSIPVVEEIKDRLDIVEIIGRYVPLKKTGRNFKGLCPFHTEKTPSFIVFPEDGHYHCFGCGQSGDIFTFIMKMENLDFAAALRLLADQAGITLAPRPETAAEDRARDRLREINATAAQYFHNLLLRSDAAKPARDFLARRGVSADTIAAWQLGYSLNSWDALTNYLTGKGYTVDDLLAAGLVRRREGLATEDKIATAAQVYDYFRGRLMFPIRDLKGNITGFGARTLGDDQPKFLNSPQTLLFDKSATLYGIDRAQQAIRKSGQVIVVEGYIDVLIAHQMGIINTVASLGTALTERQLGILKKLGKTIILALDADAAGDEATLRGLTVAREVMDRKAVPVPTWRGLVHFEYKLDADLRVLSLPRGQDPDEVLLRSVAEWHQLVQDALPLVDFYFKAITSRLDLASPKGKSAAVAQLLPIIREIDDEVAQAHYLTRLANLVQVDERLLAARLRAMRPAARQKPEEEASTRGRVTVEDYCLSLLLRHPWLYKHIIGLEPADFTDTANRQIFAALQARLNGGQPFDLAGLQGAIDPALWDHLTALTRIGEGLPQPPDSELENAIVVAALRIRLAERKGRLQRLQFAQRDPEVAADPEHMARLLADCEALREEIGYLQKALNERTLLGRRKMGGL